MKADDLYVCLTLRLDSQGGLSACRATGAVAQIKLGAPKPDEIGYAESLSCKDIGGSSVIILEQPPEHGQICSIVLKGSTDSCLMTWSGPSMMG